MHKLLTSLLASIPFSLSAMIGFFDMDVNFDPLGMKAKSHVDIAPQSSVTFSDKAWLLTPRFSIYLDGSFDVASATGLRHTTPYGYVGHHVFWSMSQTNHGKFYQVGHALDFLTPDWDFRVNYYHPLTKTQTDTRFLYSSHIWAESEALWKGDYFNVGLGPRYNFSTNCLGAQTRFVVPFKYFNVGAIVGYDYPSQLTFSISFSFSLYNSHRSSQLHDPICHKSRVRYERVELPMHNKAQKPKKDANNGLTENLGFIIEEPVVVHPTDPTTTPPKSLWAFFFEGQRTSE